MRKLERPQRGKSGGGSGIKRNTNIKNKNMNTNATIGNMGTTRSSSTRGRT
ncbi:MAG: hypothetical protein ABFC34_16650 [Methanobacterium sp.]